MKRAAKFPSTGAPDDQCLREYARLKVFQPTEIRVGGVRVRAHVLNISATGALVHYAAPLAVGTFIQIDCGGAVKSARVIRCDDQRCGVQFIVPLTQAQLLTAVECG